MEVIFKNKRFQLAAMAAYILAMCCIAMEVVR